MIFEKYFRRKILRKYWRFLLLVFAKIVITTLVFEKNAIFFTENWQKSQKILIITLVFEKNAIFVAENWQKSQKIVIITSTPCHPGHKLQPTFAMQIQSLAI
jgi:hypothetical protein